MLLRLPSFAGHSTRQDDWEQFIQKMLARDFSWSVAWLRPSGGIKPEDKHVKRIKRHLKEREAVTMISLLEQTQERRSKDMERW